jgi:hypothetical protein
MEDSLDSPSAVADLARAEMTTPTDERMSMPIIERKKSRDGSDEFPFDEDNPAADDDDLSMSPLPYEDDNDEYEDPTTLLELPENLLKLPISPVGPQDDSNE